MWSKAIFLENIEQPIRFNGTSCLRVTIFTVQKEDRLSQHRLSLKQKGSSHVGAKIFQNFRVSKEIKNRSPVLADMMIHSCAESMIGHVFGNQNAKKEDLDIF